MGKFDKAFWAEDGEKTAEEIAKLIRHKLTHVKDVKESCDEGIRKVNNIFFSSVVAWMLLTKQFYLAEIGFVSFWRKKFQEWRREIVKYSVILRKYIKKKETYRVFIFNFDLMWSVRLSSQKLK